MIFSKQTAQTILNFHSEPSLLHLIAIFPMKNCRKKLALDQPRSRVILGMIWHPLAKVYVKLDKHFSPHSFRHTFASQLLQLGESPVYVQRQLGHSPIKMTVDTYEKWLPAGNRAAVNKLDQTVSATEAQEA
jgi:integrase